MLYSHLCHCVETGQEGPVSTYKSSQRDLSERNTTDSIQVRGWDREVAVEMQGFERYFRRELTRASFWIRGL